MLRSLLNNLRHASDSKPRAQRRLHIGGEIQQAGWEVLNAVASPAVEHVGRANDLSRFSDGIFVEIYASHVLEHLDFKDEMQAALAEWYRVLAPGGTLYVSVPDLAVLAGLFLGKQLSLDDRFGIVKMMYGAHLDAHDYHKVGFDFPILAYFLAQAGFADIERVADFGLFNDTSRSRFAGVPISLNLIARRPRSG